MNAPSQTITLETLKEKFSAIYNNPERASLKSEYDLYSLKRIELERECRRIEGALTERKYLHQSAYLDGELLKSDQNYEDYIENHSRMLDARKRPTQRDLNQVRNNLSTVNERIRSCEQRAEYYRDLEYRYSAQCGTYLDGPLREFRDFAQERTYREIEIREMHTLVKIERYPNELREFALRAQIAAHDDSEALRELRRLYGSLRDDARLKIGIENWAHLRQRSKKYNEYVNKACYAILFAGIIITGGLLAAYLPKMLRKHHHSHDGPDDTYSAETATTRERSFAISGAHLMDVYHSSGARSLPESGWAGNSTASYGDCDTRLRALIDSFATTNHDVDSVLQTQAQQVNSGRQVLDDEINELQLAMPVSESLYFSGPAGPALSYYFQLAVANTAVGNGIDTTNQMHNHAREHGERLNTLAQQYDEALRTISTRNATALTPA